MIKKLSSLANNETDFKPRRLFQNVLLPFKNGAFDANPYQHHWQKYRRHRAGVSRANNVQDEKKQVQVSIIHS